jgi:cell division septation protein DedD
MKHSMVTLRLHRIAVIFIIVGAVLLAVFIFFGGYLLGGRRPAPEIGRLKPAATQSAAATTTAAAPAGEQLAIRVAVFDSESDAKALVQQLAARKLVATILPMSTSSGVTLYAVQVGQYSTRAAAAAAAASLAEEHGLQPAVVPLGR